jgi:hypothetical protein
MLAPPLLINNQKSTIKNQQSRSSLSRTSMSPIFSLRQNPFAQVLAV